MWGDRQLGRPRLSHGLQEEEVRTYVQSGAIPFHFSALHDSGGGCGIDGKGKKNLVLEAVYVCF